MFMTNAKKYWSNKKAPAERQFRQEQTKIVHAYYKARRKDLSSMKESEKFKIAIKAVLETDEATLVEKIETLRMLFVKLDTAEICEKAGKEQQEDVVH